MERVALPILHLAGSMNISYVLKLLELAAGVLFFDSLLVLWRVVVSHRFMGLPELIAMLTSTRAHEN